MTLVPWSNGRYLVWNVTCNNTIASAYVTTTSVTAGRLADWSEDKKLEHYMDLVGTHIVTPIAVEIMGAWGQTGHSVNKDNRSTSYLFQALSTTIQRGNAMIIIGILSLM